MKYQLTLQFQESSIEDYDWLIEIEEKIENTLHTSHEVDGHDFGSGEMNIFILTNNPNEAFKEINNNLALNGIKTMKAAYRELEGEKYTVLWPKDYVGEFEVK